MKYDDKLHWIYVASDIKFKNNIFPQLPLLISTYLMNNQDKTKLYFDTKVKLEDLLKYIHITYIRKGEMPLIEIVKAYVEGEDNV